MKTIIRFVELLSSGFSKRSLDNSPASHRFPFNLALLQLLPTRQLS